MRIALSLAYNGTAYHGWQSQGSLPTIQAQVERVLTQVADHRVSVICAGRTDKGVHALGQVLHFDSHTVRTDHAWVCGSNRYLPPDIRVLWARPVVEDFHARFSAIARRYRYMLLNHPIASPFMRNQASSCRRTLNEQQMQHAANYLLGEHDFSSFRASGCQAQSSIRTITHLRVIRTACWIAIDITANAFLHHMVRNIVAMLIRIGAGERDVCWAKEVLMARDRRRLARMAPAGGLYLYDVSYPKRFAIARVFVAGPFMALDEPSLPLDAV